MALNDLFSSVDDYIQILWLETQVENPSDGVWKKMPPIWKVFLLKQLLLRYYILYYTYTYMGGQLEQNKPIFYQL